MGSEPYKRIRILLVIPWSRLATALCSLLQARVLQELIVPKRMGSPT